MTKQLQFRGMFSLVHQLNRLSTEESVLFVSRSISTPLTSTPTGQQPQLAHCEEGPFSTTGVETFMIQSHDTPGQEGR